MKRYCQSESRPNVWMIAFACRGDSPGGEGANGAEDKKAVGGWLHAFCCDCRHQISSELSANVVPPSLGGKTEASLGCVREFQGRLFFSCRVSSGGGGDVRNMLRAVSQLLLGTLASQRSAVGCLPNDTKAGQTCGVWSLSVCVCVRAPVGLWYMHDTHTGNICRSTHACCAEMAV